MFRKIKDDKFLFALFFMTMVFLLGIWAGRNLYRYKYYGEASSNYEFGASEGDIQTEFAVNFPLKTLMVDINGLMRRLAGETEMNDVIEMTNGHLIDTCEMLPREEIQANADAIADYADYCKERGIEFIYVQPGYGISKWDNKLPEGVTDAHNEILDLLLDDLNMNGVNTIDLREEMHYDGISEYDMCYATDHHWTTEAGFYAFQKVAVWIQNKTGTALDEKLLDFDNYQVDRYKNWHLGSRGQRTGKLFAGVDDYDLIYPKFETRIYNSSDNTVSSFYDALIREEVFKMRNATSRYTYDTAYSKADINTLSSLDAKTDLSVLLLSDSYQHAIKPYMLLAYRDFKINSYNILSTATLEKYQPDVVVLLPHAGNACESGSFQFIDDAENSKPVSRLDK